MAAHNFWRQFTYVTPSPFYRLFKGQPQNLFPIFCDKNRSSFGGSCLQSLRLTSCAEKHVTQVPHSLDASQPTNGRASFWVGPIRSRADSTQAVIGLWVAGSCALDSSTSGLDFLDFCRVQPFLKTWTLNNCTSQHNISVKIMNVNKSQFQAT